LQKDPAAQLSLAILKTDKKEASLKYNIEGSGKNAVLLLAVLQKSAQTKVERGENAGHTLSHVQIVRELQKVHLKGNSGIANLALPDGFDAKNWEIIGILQNKSDGTVAAAARVMFSNQVNS